MITMGAGRDKSRSSKKQRNKTVPVKANPPLDQERIARLLGASSFEPVGPGGPLASYAKMKSKEQKGK